MTVGVETDCNISAGSVLNKVKVKLSLCTPWQCVWGVRVQLQKFLTLVLHTGEWSVSCPSCFTHGKRSPNCESWVGPTAGLDTSEKWKIFCPCQKLNHDFLVVQPVCSLVTILSMLSQLPLYTKYSLINSYKCGNTQDINNVIFVWLQVCIGTTGFMSSTQNSFFIQYLTFK